MVWQNKPKKAKIGLRENLSPHDIQLLVNSPLLIRFWDNFFPGFPRLGY